MSVSAMPPPANTRRLIVLLGVLAACGPISIDMYLPSLPSMAQFFSVPQVMAQLTLTTFLVGFAVGMLLYGPLSDVYGRRRVLLSGVVLYALASLGCFLAPSIHMLMAFRFVQALGAGSASVLARAIARDAHKPSEAAKVLSFLQMVTSVGPLVAPLVGGQMLLIGGWRAVFALLTLYGVMCTILVRLRVQETWTPQSGSSHAVRQSFAAYGRLLTDTTVLGHLLCGGMSYASMFAYIAGTPFVYISYYHVSPQHYGFFFAANIAGLVGGNFINAKYVGRLGTLRMIRGASALSVAASLVTGLLCATGWGGLPALAVALFLVVSATGTLAANCITDMMHRYPANSGAAAALFGAVQFGLGAASGAMVGLLSHGTPLALGEVIVGCGILAFVGRTLLIRLHGRPPRPLKTMTD